MHGRRVLLDVTPDTATFGRTSLYRITLFHDTWYRKIIVAHPEMTGNERNVEDTLARPTEIYSSTSKGGTFLFTKLGIIDQYNRPLRVVVIPTSVNDGMVASAYFTKARGGSQIWP
jgi:hypothetical protein